MTGITLQDGVSEINKYFQKYCCASKVRNASLISQHSVMIKADPRDIKDDSSCDKALRHFEAARAGHDLHGGGIRGY